MGARYGTRVLVLAGPGNNGGDGYEAARILRRRGVDVEVRALVMPDGGASPGQVAGARAMAAGVPIRRLGAPEPADLVIDALFGVGFHGDLPDEAVPWTDHAAPVLAVDLASGLDGAAGTVSGAAFVAARTVTFDAAKVGHHVADGPEHTGVLDVARIGLPAPEAQFVLCDDLDAPVPTRHRSDHKWSAGSVAVVGGSAGMVGAAVMAAEAALRFGAGAVRLIVPSGLRTEAAIGRPGIMTAGVGGVEAFSPADAGPILDALGRFDALVLGPGMGRGRGSLIAELLRRWDRPLVLDADGISGADVESIGRRTAPTVITPHAGEFERLTRAPASYQAAFDLADETGAVVLLKGNPTFVGGDERWAVDSGGPELATIGTGDILAGMIGALVARGLPAETAARSAAHRHGLAGGHLATLTSVTAIGLLDEIGRWAR